VKTPPGFTSRRFLATTRRSRAAPGGRCRRRPRTPITTSTQMSASGSPWRGSSPNRAAGRTVLVSLPQQLAVAAVVEQQAAHIPAEWLLQLACLLRSHARLSGDLRIARRLDDCRIGRGRRGSRDRYGGSARRQQRPAVCCRRCSGARSSVTSSSVRAEGLGFIAAKAVFYLDWPFASGYPDYSGGQSSTPSWRSSSPARAPARVPVGSFTAHCHVVVRTGTPSADRPQQTLRIVGGTNTPNRLTCNNIALPTQLSDTNGQHRVRALLRRVNQLSFGSGGAFSPDPNACRVL